MKSHNHLQMIAYYLLSVIVLSVVVFRSNEEFSNVPGMMVIAGIATPFMFIAIARVLLESLIVESASPMHRAKRQLALDFGLFLFVGLELFSFEILFYNHSTYVALKVLAWAIIIGYFASIDCSLKRMKQSFEEQKSNYTMSEPAVPVSHNFSQFLTATILIVILANALTAYSYMNHQSGDVEYISLSLKQDFIIDTLFIIGLVISLSLRNIHSYSLNLQRLFSQQVDILKHVQSGQLDRYAPIVSNDEFGMIASQTNVLIDKLRDQEKAYQTLSNIVSPDIMHRLLNGDRNELQQGKSYNVAILFCDLRRFTSYAEHTPPEEVIQFLNAYFTKVADIVSEHNGIINKFMGDAILAVFGVDADGGQIRDVSATKKDNYVENAVAAGWDILTHTQSAKLRDGSSFEIGMGIHTGNATAGTIGSADRYEYTFVGDAVNTASRLDGLTKSLGYKFLISSDVHKHLSSSARCVFTNLGMHTIRGKESTVHLYGASPNVSASDESQQHEYEDNVIAFAANQ